MRLYTTAESVHIEEDERGFDLRVSTVDGDDFLFCIQDVAMDFAGSEGLAALLEKHERSLRVRALSDELHSVSVNLWPGETK